MRGSKGQSGKERIGRGLGFVALSCAVVGYAGEGCGREEEVAPLLPFGFTGLNGLLVFPVNTLSAQGAKWCTDGPAANGGVRCMRRMKRRGSRGQSGKERFGRGLGFCFSERHGGGLCRVRRQPRGGGGAGRCALVVVGGGS
ncbi:hypothetical protein Nepgr_029738 [Nepenthes gracilis]|uniref:Uncharacterized protein n=1 Tax=Nepenthes gracilis TaxID=150966 RepID=A0AAD3TE51_NEPGR|nr:hypothetical protein Nepgr_029738 [Nepenthes gracilis]